MPAVDGLGTANEADRAASPAGAAPASPAVELTLVDATDIPSDEWDGLAVRPPRGHAFQSHAWGELKRPLGWTPRRFLIRRDDQAVAAVSLQVRALTSRIPRFVARAVPSRLGSLSYAYAPRGPILLADGRDARLATLAGLRDLARTLRAGVLAIDPWWLPDDELRQELATAGFRTAARDIQVSRTAMLVPLRGDDDAQHALLGTSTANRINRARRAGVEAERVDLGDGDRDAAFGEFYEMLAATGRRQGFIVRDPGYQLAQWAALADAGLAQLWFARLEGTRRCATFCLACGDTLLSYQAGSRDDADLGRNSANHLLQWEIIRAARADGFASYDMGGVDAPNARGLPGDESHPLWNLMMFKRGFGAEGREYIAAQELVGSPVTRLAWGAVHALM
jgi:lipid II:glycine glycyltransferase (peptidoglycan interpeptide bridge formation enzyme)